MQEIDNACEQRLFVVLRKLYSIFYRDSFVEIYVTISIYSYLRIILLLEIVLDLERTFITIQSNHSSRSFCGAKSFEQFFD